VSFKRKERNSQGGCPMKVMYGDCVLDSTHVKETRKRKIEYYEAGGHQQKNSVEKDIKHQPHSQETYNL